MRPNLRTALAVALACLSSGAPLLLAKPTRPAARETTHKLVQPSSAYRGHASHATPASSAGHVGHAGSARHAATSSHLRPTTHPSTAKPTRASAAATRRDAARPKASSRNADRAKPSDRATVDRVHAWVHGHPQGKTAPADASAVARQPQATEAPSADPASRLDSGTSHPPEDDQTAPFDASPADKPADVPTNIIGVLRGGDPDRPAFRSVEEQASTPVYLASLYDKRGRLVMPAPLKGSHEILLHQNQIADQDGLTRVQDDGDLLDLRRSKKLVALPESRELRVDERLPMNRRYARPWASEFLAKLAADHYARFHSAIQVNSAVRTVDFQVRLLRTNGNAAPAAGETASPHLTGQAVDIAKRGLSLAEIAWMRAYLLPLVNDGKIDVEEEFQQACFHISVYRKYLPPAPRMTIASTHRTSVTALAAAVQ